MEQWSRRIFFGYSPICCPLLIVQICCNETNTSRQHLVIILSLHYKWKHIKQCIRNLNIALELTQTSRSVCVAAALFVSPGWSCYKHTRCWTSFSTAVSNSSWPSFSWASLGNSKTWGLSGFVLAVCFKLPPKSAQQTFTIFTTSTTSFLHLAALTHHAPSDSRTYRICVTKVLNKVNYSLKNSEKC